MHALPDTEVKVKVVEYNIDDLISAEYNPRQMTADQVQALTDSIKRFGLVDPIIINTHKDRENIVIGGHQRVRIARELGIETVPCVELELDPIAERELNIRLNKNTGEWDWDALANYFDVGELLEWGFEDDDLYRFDQDYGTEFELPDGDKEPFQQMTFTLSDEQAEVVKDKLKLAKQNDFGDTGNENSNGNALWWICDSYE